MTIENRIAKLEEHARGSNVEQLSKAERDAKYAVFVESVRPVATIVQSPAELENYLKSITPRDDAGVVSLDLEQRRVAITSRIARMMFEEVRKPSSPGPNAA